MKCSYPNIKLLQLDCYLSAASRTWIENLLPLPKRDGLGGQHHHRCDYFLKPSGSIILRCFWDIQYYNDDYFTIITIIGPTINRSDASPKSTISLVVLIPIILTENSNALTKIGKLAINWCVRWSSFHLSIFYTSYFLSI